MEVNSVKPECLKNRKSDLGHSLVGDRTVREWRAHDGQAEPAWVRGLEARGRGPQRTQEGLKQSERGRRGSSERGGV